jgi:predicted DCC family thiol-disulfide oxidoreductase YuxK
VGGWRLKVLYDGECPFCRLEMRWLSRWNVRGLVAFEDISRPGFDPSGYGLVSERVMEVIHAILPDGRTVRGLEVFRLAYQAVGLGWLVAPTGWPVLRDICDGLYSLFARYRVPLGRLLGRKCPREMCGRHSVNRRDRDRRGAP